MSRILIVDDDKDTLNIARSILSLRGYQVVTLSEESDIISKIGEISPDLILLDINIGSYDGRQLCHDLKTKHGYNSHILLFSADPEKVPSLGEFKADGIIAKPVDMHTFILTVREHLPYL